MTTRTKAIAILSLPAGVVGYLVTGMVLSGLSLPDGLGGLLLIFLPLLVGGLCMVPFLMPLFDAMAKRDLAAIQEQKAKADGAAATSQAGTTGQPGTTTKPPNR